MESWAPLTGALFVVLAVVAFVLQGVPPSVTSPVAEIVDFYAKDSDSITAGSIVLGFAVVLFLFFAGILRSALSEGEGGAGTLPALVLAGAAVFTVGVAVDATITLALAQSVGEIRPAAVQALQALWDNDFIAIAAGALVFMVSSGISIARHEVLPQWLGWIAIVLGLGFATPAVIGASIGAGAWIVVVSVILSTRAGTARTAAG